MRKETVTGASTVVDFMVRDVDKPGANKEQLAAAAEAMLDTASSTPVDQVWLHVVAARALPQGETGEIIGHLEQAQSIAAKEGLGLPLTLVTLMLYTKLVEADRRDEADAALLELGDAALDKVSDALLGVGDTIARGFGRLSVQAGLGLTRLGSKLVSRSHTKAHGTTTNRQD